MNMLAPYLKCETGNSQYCMSCTCALDCAVVLNPSLWRGCGNNDKQTGEGEEIGLGGVERKKKTTGYSESFLERGKQEAREVVA